MTQSLSSSKIYTDPEVFFKDNQALMSDCLRSYNHLPRCIDLNKAEPIKHIIKHFLNEQYKSNPNPKEIASFNEDYFFHCITDHKKIDDTYINFVSCDVSRRSKILYSINEKVQVRIDGDGKQQRYSTWEESLMNDPSSEKVTTHKFSESDKPKLFEKFINSLMEEKAPINSDPETKCVPDLKTSPSPETNPINAALYALGIAGAFYCIYKICSIVSNRWKKNELENGNDIKKNNHQQANKESLENI